MGEGSLDTAFSFGLAESGWDFLWVSRGNGLLSQEFAILPDCSEFEFSFFLSNQPLPPEFAYW